MHFTKQDFNCVKGILQDMAETHDTLAKQYRHLAVYFDTGDFDEDDEIEEEYEED